MTKEQTKEKIQQLIKKYDSLNSQGKKMNEENTKNQFIRPLFEALGWNFEDDVLLEDKISHGRVDYNFQINGKTKFFLEAKPLKADIESYEYSKQATNYAWLKNINWAVLTDFEGIRIFYPAERGQVKSCLRLDLKDYISSFDDLWILSKESFQNNLIEEKAVKWGAKPEKIKVGEQLAEDMNTWRKNLYEHFKTWNSKLADQELDEGVQRILDRFIFIRSCEDRGLENDSLRSKYRIWEEQGRKGNFLAYLKPIFKEYKDNYNSGLFDDHPVMDWEISSECFDEIIDGLYRSKNFQEYDFSIIDADVLGSVYEQYLGNLLSKSDDGDISKKKRKSQGIYYTPTFIVDYIVQNTLCRVLQEKSPEEIANLKILDPACGSGSFLIKAFDYLYTQKIKKKNKPRFKNGKFALLKKAFKNRDGVEDLSLIQKINILKNNIYGVDLDQQAVEIAQLNLLLKVLEKEKKLPKLNNIRCGNSLIDDPKIVDDKAFEWNEEFTEVMQNGGFDIIIGNPPYVRVDDLGEKEKNLWKKEFRVSTGKYDLYYLFLEKSLKLLKDGGFLGFIIPNKFCVADSAKTLRKMILDNSSIVSIVSVSEIDVFKDASNYPVLILIKKGEESREINISYAKNVDQLLNPSGYTLFSRDINNLPGSVFPINTSNSSIEITKKILANNKRFEDVVKISEGLRLPVNKEEKINSDFMIVKQYQFDRYTTVDKGTFISEKNLIEVISPKSLRYSNIMGNKILIAEDALRITATIDWDKSVPQGGVYFAASSDKVNLKWLLALLNSKLLSFIYKTLFSGMHMGGGYLRYRSEFLKELPLPPNNGEDEQILIKLTDEMLNLNKELQNVQKGTNRWNQINSEIQKIDKLIDQKVYELYGLNKKEIEIVEKSAK